MRELFEAEGDKVTRCNLIKDGMCAFITFESPAQAKKQTKWNNTKYGGRTIRVNMSDEKPASTGGGAGGGGKRGEDQDRTIFVGGLPFGSTEEQMKELFSEDGTVEAVRTLNDGGCAFIVFKTVEEAKKNLKWDGTKYNGRVLKVNPAGQKPPRKN